MHGAGRVKIFLQNVFIKLRVRDCHKYGAKCLTQVLLLFTPLYSQVKVGQ